MVVSTLANVMKSAGIGKITKLGKVLAEESGVTMREAIFSNGRKGTYQVIKNGNDLEQVISDGVRRVTFNTSKCTTPTGSYFGKDDLIDLYPTNHGWRIGEYVGQSGCAKTLMAGNSKISPINVRTNIVNGKVRNKVNNLEEIHNTTIYKSDKGFGTILKHDDVLLSPNGKSQPIYHNPDKYTPACGAQLGQDLSKKPIWYSATTGCATRYTEQTPINVLNRDLNANFQAEVKPLWSRLDEMLWRLQ